MAFVSPGGARNEVDNFHGEFGSFLARSRLGEGKQKTRIGTGTWAHGHAGKRSAPKCGALRQSDFQKVALVVAHGVTRFDERLSVFREQYAVARFLDIGHEHGLLRIARDRQMKRAWRFGVGGMRTKRQ